MQKRIKKMLQTNHIRAEISENAVSEENRTVELTWTTGAKGMRRGWDGPYFEELAVDSDAVDMSRLRDGAPLLAAHGQWSLGDVIGVVERAWLENGTGKALVRFAKDETSDQVFQKVKDRVLRNVSVGYSVQEYTNVSEKGDEVPTFRATRWQPAEISIVPIGFDSGAKTRNNNELPESEVEIIERSDLSINKESAMTVKKTDLESPSVDTEALKLEAAKAERQRASDIRQAVRTANLDEKLADEYIDRGVSAEEARTNIQLFAKYAKEQDTAKVETSARIEVGVDEADKKRDGIVEAMLHRMDQTNFKRSQGNPFSNYSLLRAMESLVPRKSSESDFAYATRVMSSSDLPYLLSNTAEKAAQKKYEIQPRTWTAWAGTGTLRNYKTKDLLRSGDFASLEEVQEHGEIKRGSFGEEREQVALKDYAKMLSFTRRMLINDDLGEIQKVIGGAGAAAARLENQLVYAVLTGNPDMGDGTDLFHSSHSNVGTAAALTDASIGEAFQLMRDQTSVDGLETLNVAPEFLICGTGQEVTARKYLAQISPTQASNVNVFSNSLKLIVDSAISSNDYFFAANHSLIPTVTLFRLEGQESPRIESRTDFERSSVDIKCEHSCVAKAEDWRGLVRNLNAS